MQFSADSQFEIVHERQIERVQNSGALACFGRQLRPSTRRPAVSRGPGTGARCRCGIVVHSKTAHVFGSHPNPSSLARSRQCTSGRTVAHQLALASNFVHPCTAPLLCWSRVGVQVEVRLGCAVLLNNEEAHVLVPNWHLAVRRFDINAEEALRQLHEFARVRKLESR